MKCYLTAHAIRKELIARLRAEMFATEVDTCSLSLSLISIFYYSAIFNLS